MGMNFSHKPAWWSSGSSFFSSCRPILVRAAGPPWFSVLECSQFYKNRIAIAMTCCVILPNVCTNLGIEKW